MSTFTNDEVNFLRESNEIENVFDAISLRDAKRAWAWLRDQEQLDFSVLFRVHKMLMVNQPLPEKYKGHFRKIPVWVGGREGMKSAEIEKFMYGWCRQINSGKVGAKKLHILYEHCHPWVDGNGRTGRMFLNWYLTKKRKEPIMIIYAHKRGEYYKWFETYYAQESF